MSLKVTQPGRSLVYTLKAQWNDLSCCDDDYHIEMIAVNFVKELQATVLFQGDETSLLLSYPGICLGLVQYQIQDI